MADRVKVPFASAQEPPVAERLVGGPFGGSMQAGKTAQLAAWARSGAKSFVDELRSYPVIDQLNHYDQIPLDTKTIFVDESSHVSDAWALAALSSKQGMWATRTALPIKALTDYSDAELVMHMIERGYACMKLPKDGGPPEVLR